MTGKILLCNHVPLNSLNMIPLVVPIVIMFNVSIIGLGIEIEFSDSITTSSKFVISKLHETVIDATTELSAADLAFTFKKSTIRLFT